MLAAIVQSAFQTGCLSVESEGLIRQILAVGSCKLADLEALNALYNAVQAGQIQREARSSVQMPQMPLVSKASNCATASR